MNAALVAGFGGAMAGYGFATRVDARAMQTWPSVTGTISTSRVEEYYDRNRADDFSNQTLFRPAISYDYFVGDREYRGYRIELAVTGTGVRADAEYVVRHYPVGKEVTVYYDPANPRECILDRASAPAWAALFTTIGVLIALGGLGWIAMVLLGVIDA